MTNLCEQVDSEGLICNEPAVATVNNIPLCVLHYEKATGEPYCDEEEDLSMEDIMELDAQRKENI